MQRQILSSSEGVAGNIGCDTTLRATDKGQGLGGKCLDIHCLREAEGDGIGGQVEVKGKQLWIGKVWCVPVGDGSIRWEISIASIVLHCAACDGDVGAVNRCGQLFKFLDSI